jgi:hypothetical protein
LRKTPVLARQELVRSGMNMELKGYITSILFLFCCSRSTGRGINPLKRFRAARLYLVIFSRTYGESEEVGLGFIGIYGWVGSTSKREELRHCGLFVEAPGPVLMV